MLFHHLFYSMDRVSANGVDISMISLATLSQIATGARVCVWIFAFLSAYGLTVQYKEMVDHEGRAIKVFVKRYWLRLMRPYCFVWFLSYFLSFFFFRNPVELYQKNIVYMALDFLGLADFFKTPTMLGAWWYICFAQIVILLIPVIAEAGKKLGIILMPLAFVLIQYLPDGISSPYGGRYKSYFIVVVLGSLCAEYDIFQYFVSKSNHRGVRTGEACTYIIGILLLLYVNEKYLKSNETMVGTVAVSFAVFFMCVWCQKYFTFSILNRIFSTLGKHSGTMYLIHSFSYTYYAKYVYWSHNVIVIWLELLVISFVAAVGINAIQKKLP